MSITGDAGAAYAAGVPVSKDNIKALWALVQTVADAAVQEVSAVAGTGDAITGTVNPLYFDKATTFIFRLVANNTVAVPTLQLNGGTARIVRRGDGTPLLPDDLKLGRLIALRRVGAEFFLQSGVDSELPDSSKKGVFAVVDDGADVVADAAQLLFTPSLSAVADVDTIKAGGSWKVSFVEIGSGAKVTYGPDGLGFAAGVYLRGLLASGYGDGGFGRATILMDLTVTVAPVGNVTLIQLATGDVEFKVSLIGALDGDKYKFRVQGPDVSLIDSINYFKVGDRVTFVFSVDYQGGTLTAIDDDGRAVTVSFPVSDPVDLLDVTDIRIGQGFTGQIHNLNTIAEVAK